MSNKPTPPKLRVGGTYIAADQSVVTIGVPDPILGFRISAGHPSLYYPDGEHAPINVSKNLVCEMPPGWVRDVPFEELGPVHRMVKDAFTSMGEANPDKPGMYWWVAEYGSGRWGSNPAQFHAAFKAAFTNASKGAST